MTAYTHNHISNSSGDNLAYHSTCGIKTFGLTCSTYVLAHLLVYDFVRIHTSPRCLACVLAPYLQQEHISSRIHGKPITSLTTRIWGMCYGLARNTMPPLANLSSVLIHSSFDCFCYCLKHVSIGRNAYTHPVNQAQWPLKNAWPYPHVETISAPLVLLVNIAVCASLEFY